jgi:outer membrane protein TolC
MLDADPDPHWWRSFGDPQLDLVSLYKALGGGWQSDAQASGASVPADTREGG